MVVSMSNKLQFVVDSQPQVNADNFDRKQIRSTGWILQLFLMSVLPIGIYLRSSAAAFFRRK
jgi:hypothetical protein